VISGLDLIDRNNTHLQNLSIARNKLQTVESGSLQHLSSLQSFDISGNQELTLEVLVTISKDLQNSLTIRTLNFESVECTYGVSVIIRRYHLACLKHSFLEELNLASNRIHSLEFGVLNDLPKSLKHLNIANNILSYGHYIIEFGVLQNLVTLNLSFSLLFTK
jgi:Leucine-rich repeat (LRR) protein